jgi:hypothetical protein
MDEEPLGNRYRKRKLRFIVANLVAHPTENIRNRIIVPSIGWPLAIAVMNSGIFFLGAFINFSKPSKGSFSGVWRNTISQLHEEEEENKLYVEMKAKTELPENDFASALNRSVYKNDIFRIISPR